jgi:hypothetical protein
MVQFKKRMLENSRLIGVALNKLKMAKITIRMTYSGRLALALELRAVQKL